MQKVTVGTFEQELEVFEFLSIGEIMGICNDFCDHYFVFEGTDLSPCDLGSWRGSYDTPRIGYGGHRLTGVEISAILSDALEEKHYGYKGGEYHYGESEVPYIDNDGDYNEACIYEYEVIGKYVILKTAINQR